MGLRSTTVHFSTSQPLLAAAALVVGSLWGAIPVHAEGTDAAAGRDTLSEVVVTARKREESLQDTPISVTAITSSDLESRGITRLDDLSGAAPSLGWQASPAGGSSTANFYIRGVGQFDFIATSDQSVGLYLDGVYLPRSIGAALDVVDVERIEILRGPQGTLFGRNTIGGAVQVITQGPSSKFEGSVEVTGGSRDHADLKAHVNLPLGDSAALRLSVATLNQDGYGERLLTGQSTGNVHNQAVRGQFRWVPGEPWEILLSADASRRRGHAGAETLLSNDDSNAFLALYNNTVLAPQGFPRISAANFVTGKPGYTWAGSANIDNYDTRGASATVHWSGGDAFEVKSISAWRSLKSATAFDFDGSPYPLLDQAVGVEQHQLSEELQLSGKTADARLNWLTGLYYFREDVTENDVASLLAPITRTGPGTYDFSVQGLGFGYTTYLSQITDSWALYGQASWQLAARLSLTAGLRYTLDQKELTSANTGAVTRGPNTVSDTWGAATPKLGLDYKLDPNKLLYISASEGYRSGGFNGRETVAVKPDAYNPEHLWAYETGFKSDLLERRLRLNLAAYYYDYRDKQGSELRPDATVTVGNIGRVALYGAEFEVTAVPLHGLQLSLGGGYEHQDIREVDPAGGLTLRPDTQLENTPEFTGNGTLSYTMELGALGDLTLYTDVRYKSASEFLEPNYPGERQGAYAIADARVSLSSRSNTWQLQVFVKNFMDTQYRTFTESTAGFGFPGVIGTYGPPREWGGTVKYNF